MIANWFKRKKAPVSAPPIEHDEPYAFTPGFVYVIAFDSYKTSIDDLKDLYNYFKTEGVHVKFVPSHMQLKPINSKTLQRRLQ
jgi:hypothetical protein